MLQVKLWVVVVVVPAVVSVVSVVSVPGFAAWLTAALCVAWAQHGWRPFLRENPRSPSSKWSPKNLFSSRQGSGARLRLWLKSGQFHICLLPTESGAYGTYSTYTPAR